MLGTEKAQLDIMPECRVVVVVDKGVGKTVLIRIFETGMFLEECLLFYKGRRH